MAEISRISTLTLFLPPDRIDLTFLNGTQELDLGIEGQFTDFIEEQRAAARLGKFADMLFGGAGESTFLVPEQG